MTTNSAALKRDGVRANNRPSISDENFKRMVTSAIRESRTSIRRDGGDTYDIVLWLDEYLRSQNVTSKVQHGTLVLPSGRLVLEHYWVQVANVIVDPTIDKFRSELSLDVAYADVSQELHGRYFKQKTDSEEEERRSVITRAKRLGLID